MDHPMTLAARIALERASRAWTLQDLSEATGLSENQLAKIESGAPVKPFASTLLALSRALGIPFEELHALSLAARASSEPAQPIGGRAAVDPGSTSPTPPRGGSDPSRAGANGARDDRPEGAAASVA